MHICIFEDDDVGNLQPLTTTRPAFDLRCGATTLVEKHSRAFAQRPFAVFVRRELAALCRLAHPDLRVNDPHFADGETGLVMFVNARWLVPAAGIPLSGRPEIGMIGDEVAYAVVPAAEASGLTLDTLAWQLGRWRQALPHRAAGGSLLAYPWGLIEHNAAALEEDFNGLDKSISSTAPAGVALVGPADRLWAHPTARIEPMVVLDTTRGPVMIDRDAVVQAFSRIEGPCYIGPGTHVMGAKVRASSLGPECRIGGEVEASIVQGHSNKAHDGILGHSYLGEWVNFGAGTHTSDLRTDYGTVKFNINGQSVDSKLMKVGAFIGDHTKTSLAALLNTGTMVGPFGLLLTSGTLLPRQVPAFAEVAHGRVEERNDLRAMFATAATVMARRGHEWTPAHTELFLLLYESSAPTRRQLLRENEQRRLRRVI